MKVYICDKLMSSVNDVKCSYERSYVINDTSYLILLCLESLVLKHNTTSYVTLVASFNKKNSGGICCHILEVIFM